jgi:hypothetical protein
LAKEGGTTDTRIFSPLSVPRLWDTIGRYFIEPMYALAVQNIPEGKEWLYEVKFDGIGAWLEEMKRT